MSKFEFDMVARGQSLAISSMFQEIRYDASTKLIEQLVGKDAVHVKGADSVKALREYRLGGDGMNRACYAMVDDGEILSAIYVHKDYAPIGSDRHLRGNVAEVLESKTIENSLDPKSAILYSITNIAGPSGTGQKLVVNLGLWFSALYSSTVVSTLSPLRSFDEAFKPEQDRDFSIRTRQEKICAAMNHILTGKDGVMGFHLGNGARIGDIKLNTGDHYEIKRDGVGTGNWRNSLAMMNYVYDGLAEERHARAQEFSIVKKIMRSPDVDPIEKMSRVRDALTGLFSPTLMEDAGITPQLVPHMMSVKNEPGLYL